MAQWTDYTKKDIPADDDDMMIFDEKGNANKRLLFSGIWSWIVGKFGTGNVSTLKTTDKTVSGSINELYNGKANGEGITFSINESGGLNVTYDDGE